MVKYKPLTQQEYHQKIETTLRFLAQLNNCSIAQLPTSLQEKIIDATLTIELKNREQQLTLEVGEIAEMLKSKQMIDDMAEIQKLLEETTQIVNELKEEQEKTEKEVERINDEVYELREG